MATSGLFVAPHSQFNAAAFFIRQTYPGSKNGPWARRGGALDERPGFIFKRNTAESCDDSEGELRGLLSDGLYAAPGSGTLLLGGDAFRDLKNGDGSDKLPHAGRVEVHDRAALIALDNGATPIF